MEHRCFTRARSDMPHDERWDLGSLFHGPQAWEEAYNLLEELVARIDSHKSACAQTGESLSRVLCFFRDYHILAERLGYYAELRLAEDEGDSSSRSRSCRFQALHARGESAWAWLKPWILAVPEAALGSWLLEPELAEFRVFLQKLPRLKAHILGEAEERLLALQAEKDSCARTAFTLLCTVDFDFGSVETTEGSRKLTLSGFSAFMRHPDRAVRKNAYKRFYGVFDAHRHSLAQLYSSSCSADRYQALVRKFPSCRAMALFPDNVHESVYDNLVSTVSANLGALHGYYDLRKRLLAKTHTSADLRLYDVQVPLVPATRARHGYPQAVDEISLALAPLGGDYVDALRAGLLGTWVDRYENPGKRTGAFSAGTYTGEPYILMNYREGAVRDMFTLAHEAGHSMHSRYSAAANPFMHYKSTIFEAEVASTFNEHLLFRHLYQRSESDTSRAYLLNSRIDDIIATFFRQTMLAEYEANTHAALESGTPLTLDFLRGEYSRLLGKYFGPALVFDGESSLECLRIPHFYTAFYVYKYATGFAASLALSNQVLSGGEEERRRYRAFLESGGSLFPIESLSRAGVDMASSAPIQETCDEFADLVSRLSAFVEV